MKCIRIKGTGVIERVCDTIAQKRVSQGEATFVSKSEWRAKRPKAGA